MGTDDSGSDDDRARFGEAFSRYRLGDPLLRSRLRRTAIPIGRPGADSVVRSDRMPRLALPRMREGLAEAPPEEPSSEPALTYIGFQLVDKEGRPIPEEPFRAKLTDGRTVEDKLDASGSVRFEDLPPGICSIQFHRIHLHPRYRDGASAG